MTMGPLWYSPYGAHMYGFTWVPWLHFLFPENIVLQVRRDVYRPDDPAQCYEDIRGHLNRLTIRQFREYATRAGLEIRVLRVNPGLDRGIMRPINSFINSLGFMAELCVHSVVAVLDKPSALDSPRAERT